MVLKRFFIFNYNYFMIRNFKKKLCQHQDSDLSKTYHTFEPRSLLTHSEILTKKYFPYTGIGPPEYIGENRYLTTGYRDKCSMKD